MTFDCIHLGCNRLFQGHHYKCPVASDVDPLTLPEACSVVGPYPIIVKTK
jgi:hypothetical protein